MPTRRADPDDAQLERPQSSFLSSARLYMLQIVHPQVVAPSVALNSF